MLSFHSVFEPATRTLTMISKCYVWKWLPGETRPVVAGELRFDAQGRQAFVYGRSFMDRVNAEPIYAQELGLRRGNQVPINGLTHFSCLRDAAPDAWGRRVILNGLFAREMMNDERGVDESVYLLQSGSDRTGALDFQESASIYKPRHHDSASLEDLCRAAELLATEKTVPPDLEAALFHGSSIGGARPKAAVSGSHCKYVAKFSVSTDTFNIVKAEYVAMKLAAAVGLDVAPVSLQESAGRDVILVERFDRGQGDGEGDWTRKSLVSGLTVLGLDEKWAREASYPDLVEQIRLHGVNFKTDARELFSRMLFNVLIGNTDDHARNHSFFVEGESIRLTPAYDVTPFPRAGGEAGHGMKIFGPSNLSRISLCIATASAFGIMREEAIAIAEAQIAGVAGQFDGLCESAGMDRTTRLLLRRRAVLNPDIFAGAYEWLNPDW